VAAGLLEVEPRDLPIDPTLRQPELELDAYLGIWSALPRRERNARRVKTSNDRALFWACDLRQLLALAASRTRDNTR
jgi:hypothetical protein